MPAISENSESNDNRDQIFSIWRPELEPWLNQQLGACSEADLGYKMILGKNRYGRGDTMYLVDNRSAVEKTLDRLLHKMSDLLSSVMPRTADNLDRALSGRAEHNVSIQDGKNL